VTLVHLPPKSPELNPVENLWHYLRSHYWSTPGTNQKKHIAGSLNWRTGKLIATVGGSRNVALFCKHLDELRSAYRCYRVIHVVLDNARFHTDSGSKLVRRYLEKWGERIVLHYLPSYSPDTNPIERVWWHMHDQVTRNHRCPDIDSLLRMVIRWLEQKGTFEIEGNHYPRTKAA
jgi:transposase